MKLARLAVICVVSVFLMTGSVMAAAKETKKTVGYGRKVKFDYVLKVDGKEFETSKASGPASYKQGDGTLIPGLAKQMQGMAVGEEKDIVVKPEEAYGKVDPDGTKEVPLSAMPKDVELKAGALLQGKDSKGRVFPVKVVKVKKDTVVVDHNHPLAGKTLEFKVKIVSVE